MTNDLNDMKLSFFLLFVKRIKSINFTAILQILWQYIREGYIVVRRANPRRYASKFSNDIL